MSEYQSTFKGAEIDYAIAKARSTQQMITYCESSTTATRNYAIGDLVIVGNVLYKVTAAIASGETITQGTNVAEVNIADEIAKFTNAFKTSPKLAYGYFGNAALKFTHNSTYPHNRAYCVYDAKKGDVVVSSTGKSFQITETDKAYSYATNLTSKYINAFTFDADKYVIVTVKDDNNANDFGTEAELSTSITIIGIPDSRLDTDKEIQGIKDYLGLSVGTTVYPENLFNPAQAAENKFIKFTTGALTNSSIAGRYASDYIPVTPSEKYTINFSFYSADAGIAFYDSSKAYVSGMRQSKYQTSDTSKFRYNFDFVVPNGCYYCRISTTNNIKNINDIVFTKYVQKIEKNDKEIPESVMFQYSGDKITLGNKFYGSQYMLMTHTPVSGSSNQGGACYGKYYFQFEDALRAVHVYDMETKSLVQDITPTSISGLHGNNANFGVEKYDADDDFPLVYVASASLDKVYVFRISGTVGEWALTNVQTISWDENDGVYYTCMAVDKENEWLVQFGYTVNSLDATGNACKINVFDLPKLSEGDITISDSTKKYSHIIPFAAYYQGTVSLCGRLFMSHGNQSTKNMIRVVDASTGTITNVIDFEDTPVKTLIGNEPEGLFVYNDTMYVAGCKTANSGTNAIVELYFI